MSIDYPFYPAALPYTSVMASIDFRTLADRKHVVQGETDSSSLLACLVTTNGKQLHSAQDDHTAQ